MSALLGHSLYYYSQFPYLLRTDIVLFVVEHKIVQRTEELLTTKWIFITTRILKAFGIDASDINLTILDESCRIQLPAALAFFLGSQACYCLQHLIIAGSDANLFLGLSKP